jgi:hypothetical protein
MVHSTSLAAFDGLQESLQIILTLLGMLAAVLLINYAAAKTGAEKKRTLRWLIIGCAVMLGNTALVMLLERVQQLW